MTEGKQIYYHRLRENSRKMNPRFKELAVEAGAYLDNGAILHGPMDVAKFAELIVKEMLQTCEDHPAWTGRMISEQIKQHFGVEE
jgi:hypothetical protein